MVNAAIAFGQPSPILRIFDDEKAREFYCHFLGLHLVWEHRFEPGLPLYAEVERAGLRLHLSGHHGDACPGSTVFVRMTGIRAFQAELLARNQGFARPGIEALPWGLVMEIADPFGNRLRFCEETPEA
ncbi:catechol 2,3-dioxygenase-like lactoylglutathione lyase family enzyme [Pseudomonas sp. SORGH_AS 211]|uniref:glyoxalase superfamily protein n=1 Tax=Pseudomonas sp. SORGH_AS_0211 TaxID=3041796 RepID=UPI002854DF8B|nr:glyoxalase superfamily protein [Pseudomonas sp. SORGH_AS_0211]MDR6177345.1 catechol 2,3-dioxygenase-like lactoylglutathione lyase family enzyme [Pseudomonas sp. SORGH_AS_0211]